MVRFGVIGAGWFASRRHLPELAAHPEVDLVALCRRSPEPLRRLADHFGVPQTYTDPAAMLAEARLDAVLVCSPHDLHHAHAAAALDAGCHVLLEKPMTVTVADARDLTARAAAAGRLLEVAYNPPFWPHTCWLRERVEADDLGAIETVDLRWTGNVEALFGRDDLPDNLPGVVPPTLFRGDPAANGGGHLIDSGSHQVCEVLWVTGQQPRFVTAAMDSAPDDLRFALTLDLTGGGYATITSVGDSAHPGRRLWNLYQGSRGTAVITGPPFTVAWTPAGGGTVTLSEADLPQPPQLVVGFVDAIAGRGPLRSPGSACVAYVDVVAAAYRAALTGRRQALAPA